MNGLYQQTCSLRSIVLESWIRPNYMAEIKVTDEYYKGYSGEENVCRRTNPIPTWNWKNLKLNSIIETPALLLLLLLLFNNN